MKNLKNCIILSLFLSILLVPITFRLLDIQESGKNSELEFGYLNSAGSWVLAPFAINPYGAYTWDDANATDWCSGAGTELDPWIIENITIDSGGLSNCLDILNSDDYFIIRNSTFKNSQPEYGLYMGSTSNGIVEDCTFFNNTIALSTSSSQNNTVQDNYFYNNTGASIRLYGLSNNMNNTVRHNRFVNRLTFSNPTAFSVQGYNNKLINNTVDNFLFGVNLNYANQTLIKSNTFISSWYGISIGGNSFNATVFNNTIRDNHNEYGVYVNGNGSIIYRNTFINNNVNAKDSGHFNRWDNGVIGNYWDDYGGSDLNDDGIGDTPYSLPDSGSSQDNFPIWEDGDDTNPTLTLNSPAPGSTFGNDAPTFNLDVFDVNLDQAWYVINNTSTKYFFTPINGVNLVSIDETAWDALVQGSLVISFFVNDTASNEETLDVNINKDVAPQISLVEPLGGSIFAEDAPVFNITLFDVNFDQAWYTINSGTTKFFFNPLNGLNHIPINQTAWEGLPEGSVIISFFINDTGGNINSLDVTINKDLPPPPTPPPGILFGNYFIVFMGIGIISLLIIVTRKRKLIHS
jgi:parallel beta-helix repeat protein